MYEGPVQNLIDELGRLPGVGPKGAQRIAFHLLNQEPDTIDRLANAVAALRDGATMLDVPAVVDGKIITGHGPGWALEFALTILAEVVSAQTAEDVRAGLLLD